MQLLSIRYGENQAESEDEASVGSHGDSYDKATAEAVNSAYKAGLTDRKVWSELIEVMSATSRWVTWYTRSRLHSAIGCRQPFEIHSQRNNQTTKDSAAA
ncbi:integrase core domain-containing protein [Corynebacterium hansenii]|uniref:Integrase core domain-containing protein n=1 Tax=Corynebacterium hansenii TaxID=394964 RepID=A0ABV7ZJR8_9CORY